jgi:Sec7-like guanine-nucleotide exchange factor
MTGEAQEIDRTLEAFGRQYNVDNPLAFANLGM